MAEYAHLSKIDPELEAVFAQLPQQSPPSSIAEFRALSVGLRQMCQSNHQSDLPQESEYKVNDLEIDVGVGVKVKARSVVPSPKEGEDKFPLLFWMHGGGFVIGDLHMDDYKLRRVAVDARVSIVNCEYRLAPEHPFPAAPDDCFAALKFVASHLEQFSADLSKGFIVGGASAGGNLAAVLSHLARDDSFFNDKPLSGQLLVIPSLVHYQGYPEKYKDRLLSLEQNKDAPGFSKTGFEMLNGLYKATPTDTKVSPLCLTSHAGLPPAYLQVCGLDPLRDEGLLYEQVLKEAGVKTKIDIYPGVTHGFDAFAPNITQAKKFNADFTVGLKWLLGHRVL